MELTEPRPVFVKLGGSLITDKSTPYTVRSDVIARICAEIHRARSALRVPRSVFPLVVGHGGGSFPHVSASRYRTDLGVVDVRSWEGFVRVHQDAARLNAIVCEALVEAGELAMPVQPSSACVASGRRIVSWDLGPLRDFLQAGLLPVPYGDVCVDRRQGCCIISTEEIFRYLCGALGPEQVLLVGKVDGVMDPGGEVIPRITSGDLDELREALAPSDGIADVTGGMLHKVERALEMGATVRIINGLVPGRLYRALMGEEVQGTELTADS